MTAHVPAAGGSGVPNDNSVTSAKIADGAIVDADVNASANIAQSKIAGLVTALGLLLAKASNLSDIASPAAARANLGVVIGARPANHGMLAWVGDPQAQVNSSILPTAGTVYGSRIWLDAPISVSTIWLNLTTAGSGLTAGQCFAGLFQGGSLVGTSVDQATNWQTSGDRQCSINGGPVALAAGDVLVCVFANGTTLPTLSRGGGQTRMNNAGLSAANSRHFSADTGRTTSFPASIGALTASSISYWFGLS